MKIYTLPLLAFLLLLGGNAMAQKPSPHIDSEKLQAARVAFITTRIDLKTEQAEKFWPIFNEYSDQREKSMRKLAELGKGVESINESECSARIKKRFDLQQEMLEEEKQFVGEVSKFLTSRQILQLNNINRDFARYIYQRQRGDKRQ